MAMRTTQFGRWIRRCWIPAISIVWLTHGTPAQAEYGRPWDLSLRLFSEYNDNVPLAADDTDFSGEQKSLGAGFSAAGVYRIIQEYPWEVGVGAGFVQTGYLESNVNDFNFTSIAPRVYGRYLFNLGAMPARAEAAFTFRDDLLDFEQFEQSYIPALSLTVFPIDPLAITAYTRLSIDQFDDDGADPAVTSRDATQYVVGLNGRYVFPGGMQNVGLTGEYRHNDADGDNFTYDSYIVSADFWTHIVGPFSASVSGGYTNEDYTDFTTDPKRTQDNLYGTVTVYMALSHELTLDAYYSYTHMDGSTDAFSLDRSIVGVGLTYRP